MREKVSLNFTKERPMCVTSSESQRGTAESEDDSGSSQSRGSSSDLHSSSDSPGGTVEMGSLDHRLGLETHLVYIVLGILRLVPLSAKGSGEDVIRTGRAQGVLSLEVLELHLFLESVKTGGGSAVDVTSCS